MSNIETGGPAFPGYYFPANHGMTMRQYAAIALRVPNSGTAWLDDMISEAQRDEFATKAMLIMWEAYDKGYCGDVSPDTQNNELIAVGAYQLADAMLAAREVRK